MRIFARIGDVPSAAVIRRPCWRKQQHPSRGAAEAHRRALLRQAHVIAADALNTYRCRHCGHFHVGHTAR